RCSFRASRCPCQMGRPPAFPCTRCPVGSTSCLDRRARPPRLRWADLLPATSCRRPGPRPRRLWDPDRCQSARRCTASARHPVRLLSIEVIYTRISTEPHRSMAAMVPSISTVAIVEVLAELLPELFERLLRRRNGLTMSDFVAHELGVKLARQLQAGVAFGA